MSLYFYEVDLESLDVSLPHVVPSMSSHEFISAMAVTEATTLIVSVMTSSLSEPHSSQGTSTSSVRRRVWDSDWALLKDETVDLPESVRVDVAYPYYTWWAPEQYSPAWGFATYGNDEPGQYAYIHGADVAALPKLIVVGTSSVSIVKDGEYATLAGPVVQATTRHQYIVGTGWPDGTVARYRGIGAQRGWGILM